HNDGIINDPQRATIEQSGKTGRPNNFEYNMNTRLLKLNGDVHIETAEHVEVETATALFQQKENWTAMSGGVLMKSATGWIRGSTGRADREPGTYKPKTITVEGNVTSESQPTADGEAWKARARSMQATMSKD